MKVTGIRLIGLAALLCICSPTPAGGEPQLCPSTCIASFIPLVTPSGVCCFTVSAAGSGLANGSSNNPCGPANTCELCSGTVALSLVNGFCSGSASWTITTPTGSTMGSGNVSSAEHAEKRCGAAATAVYTIKGTFGSCSDTASIGFRCDC